MDGPTSDYAYAYSDVFQSPSPDEGGIYTLEEAGRDTDPRTQTTIKNRYSSDLRMREVPWPVAAPTGIARCADD